MRCVELCECTIKLFMAFDGYMYAVVYKVCILRVRYIGLEGLEVKSNLYIKRENLNYYIYKWMLASP